MQHRRHYVCDVSVCACVRACVRLAVAAEAVERDEEGGAEAARRGGGHAAPRAHRSADAASSLLGDRRHRPPRQTARDAGASAPVGRIARTHALREYVRLLTLSFTLGS